jgi:uncharacterized protein (UPF0335 family)
MPSRKNIAAAAVVGVLATGTVAACTTTGTVAAGTVAAGTTTGTVAASTTVGAAAKSGAAAKAVTALSGWATANPALAITCAGVGVIFAVFVGGAIVYCVMKRNSATNNVNVEAAPVANIAPHIHINVNGNNVVLTPPDLQALIDRLYQEKKNLKKQINVILKDTQAWHQEKQVLRNEVEQLKVKNAGLQNQMNLFERKVDALLAANNQGN